MENGRKTLIISVSGMGDTLLATPAIEALRRLRPQETIDLLIDGEGTRSLLLGNKSVDNVFDLGYGRGLRSALRTALALRRRRYDISIRMCPSNKPHYGFLERLVGARTRLAHSYPDSRVPDIPWSRTHSVPAAGELHNIRQNLRLVDADCGDEREMPRPRLFLEEQDRAFACKFWERVKPRRPVIAVHPGGGDKPGRRQRAKRWPLENYVETVTRLRRELDATVLVLTGPHEVSILPQLVQSVERSGLDRIHFPQAPIREVAGLIERCDLLLCNDNGIMHIATALCRPVLALFGPTSPKNTAPMWPDCRALIGGSCPKMPCLRYPFQTVRSSIDCDHPICWGRVTPSLVVAEARALLDSHRAQP